MISINGLKKKFGSLPVLNGVDLEIENGLIYGLVGESGQGKSTLLRCINGLVGYDGGSLKVDGIEVCSYKEKELRKFRRNVGMIFQTYSLLERSNVFDNVAFPMKIWNFDEKTISDKVWSMIELVGLTDKANNYPRELSGGQKQRVAIARSLVMNPKYILSDESTSALDPNTAQSILYLLKKINKELNITILIVAHQMEVIRQTCDRMAILKGGKISVNDTVKNVFLRQPTELKQLMGDTDAKYVPGKVFLRVYVPEKEEYSVFFYKLARETGVEFCLEAGGIKLFREGPAFLGMISVEHGNIKKVLNFLDITGIDYEVINDGI